MTKIKPTTAWAVVDSVGQILVYTTSDHEDGARYKFEALHGRSMESYAGFRVVKVRITGEDDE